MKSEVKQIIGNWDGGYALDKHKLSSVFLGHNEQGYPQFDTTRTEVGEALYQLKYKFDNAQVAPLANALASSIYPIFNNVGLLIPMPASKKRAIQPVTEIANELGRIVAKPVFNNLLTKTPNGSQLKDLKTKQDKLEALGECFAVQDVIQGDGPWNALLIDDIFDTGASLEAVCAVLRTYPKIEKIYVATLTWK